MTLDLELRERQRRFVTMFRKAVGKPPARYLAERNAAGQSPGDCDQHVNSRH